MDTTYAFPAKKSRFDFLDSCFFCRRAFRRGRQSNWRFLQEAWQFDRSSPQFTATAPEPAEERDGQEEKWKSRDRAAGDASRGTDGVAWANAHANAHAHAASAHGAVGNRRPSDEEVAAGPALRDSRAQQGGICHKSLRP
jgi:hypothetical protein